MAGSATIPIEAALAAADRVPRPDLDPMFGALPGYDGERFRELRGEHAPETPTLDIEARDRREKWCRCARRNCDAAGVSDTVDVVAADAREASIDADCVVTNLPFGIRTGEDLRALYDSFWERLSEGSADRLVALTTAPDLLPFEPTDSYDIPYGRLEATIVVREL
jgi:tRNA (guanine6-N2)-methyltransferase